MSDEFKPTPPHVYTAIADVMGKLAKVGIGKNNKNTQQGYKFRGIDDVYNALSGLLSEAKLMILPRVRNRIVTERETKNGGVLFYVVVDVDFDLVSAVDGSSHTVHVIGEAMDSGDKATNKAMSAAYKYACMEVFCIPTEGDNDADATTHEGIKPGIGVHSPMGDTEVTMEAKLYASNFLLALKKENAARVLQIHDDLHEEGEEAYRNAWSLLDSTPRRKIKEIISARDAEKQRLAAAAAVTTTQNGASA
jgi:hypothetical protein